MDTYNVQLELHLRGLQSEKILLEMGLEHAVSLAELHRTRLKILDAQIEAAQARMREHQGQTSANGAVIVSHMQPAPAFREEWHGQADMLRQQIKAVEVEIDQTGQYQKESEERRHRQLKKLDFLHELLAIAEANASK
ncbi:MAG: hypothetical protein EOP50_11890 [Sphingobacteriales bacterium]|nr:MAG: hypothetical protein EOP50_11890 [Sphingobacteriales bacterium]